VVVHFPEVANTHNTLAFASWADNYFRYVFLVKHVFEILICKKGAAHTINHYGNQLPFSLKLPPLVSCISSVCKELSLEESGEALSVMLTNPSCHALPAVYQPKNLKK
jgi:hypothetical protein